MTSAQQTNEAGAAGNDGMAASHPRLAALVQKAHEQAKTRLCRVGIVYPGDAAALDAAACIAQSGLATPVLIGPAGVVSKAAKEAGVDASTLEMVDTGEAPADAAARAMQLARDGSIDIVMKGSLHTDELMSAVVDKHTGLRGDSRISHVFLFDLPRYPKLIGLADCVVNIAPNLKTKVDIIGNAVDLLHRLGVAKPKVGIVAAVEMVNPAIPATLDAEQLVAMGRAGQWPDSLVEGPFGFDNVISAEAARIKKIDSTVSGDADLLLMPDLNAGNILYKSFIYIGGGECAGLVLGARVPIVLTSRADSLDSRLASVALAVLAAS